MLATEAWFLPLSGTAHRCPSLLFWLPSSAAPTPGGGPRKSSSHRAALPHSRTHTHTQTHILAHNRIVRCRRVFVEVRCHLALRVVVVWAVATAVVGMVPTEKGEGVEGMGV